MKIIDFKYDYKKDAYNWLRQVVFMPSNSTDEIPSTIQKEIKHLYKLNQISHQDLLNSIDHPALDFIIEYIKKNKDMELIESIKKELEELWREKEEQFIKILSEIIQKPIYEASYSCYLSTIHNCPFYEKENWIMVSAFSNRNNQIYVVAHEFMHLQFIYWYKEYCLNKGLTNKDFWRIQEAITFLLNEPEFKNIFSFKDKGYKDHQKLRKELKNIWKKDKNFKSFLDKTINCL